MKIATLVKITDSRQGTELDTLVCRAAKGEFVELTKGNSSDIAHLEASVNKAFDKFAQDMFDKGRAYEREVRGNA